MNDGPSGFVRGGEREREADDTLLEHQVGVAERGCGYFDEKVVRAKGGRHGDSADLVWLVELKDLHGLHRFGDG